MPEITEKSLSRHGYFATHNELNLHWKVRFFLLAGDQALCPGRAGLCPRPPLCVWRALIAESPTACVSVQSVDFWLPRPEFLGLSHCFVRPQACKAVKRSWWFPYWNVLSDVTMKGKSKMGDVLLHYLQIPQFNSADVPR